MLILLQFPEGLKQYALEHARKLEEEGNEVVISASPTFGACDLAIEEARRIGADKIVHFGHAEFQRVDFNVEYVEYHVDASLDLLPESLGKLKGARRICLLTTIQHVQQLGAIRKFYEENGKEVTYNKPNGFAKREGQILGCDDGNVAQLDGEVDAFVYFGGGLFHPIGALLRTTKPFLIMDPFSNRIEFIDGQREVYRKRHVARLSRATGAKTFGILVSTKNGQYNMELARQLQQMIRQAGLQSVILTANTFDFESLNNMLEFDAFVNTACPRLATEDNERLRKPLLAASELSELLEMLKGPERSSRHHRSSCFRIILRYPILKNEKNEKKERSKGPLRQKQKPAFRSGRSYGQGCYLYVVRTCAAAAAAQVPVSCVVVSVAPDPVV